MNSNPDDTDGTDKPQGAGIDQATAIAAAVDAFEQAVEKLKPQYQRFVSEYLVDFNAGKAWIRSGYSPNGARQSAFLALKRPDVKAAVNAGKAARIAKTNVTEDYVITTIRETIERCRQDIRPVLNRKGEHVIGKDANGNEGLLYEFDSKSVLKGCEMLARKLGMFRDRVEHVGKDGKDLFADVPADEVARRCAYLLTRGEKVAADAATPADTPKPH